MTAQEALDSLCNHAMVYEEYFDYEENDCGRYVRIEEVELDTMKNTLQELIERDTPKKPIFISDYDGFVYECPVCHMDFRPDFIAEHIKWEGCPYCLQKLDWSE